MKYHFHMDSQNQNSDICETHKRLFHICVDNHVKCGGHFVKVILVGVHRIWIPKKIIGFRKKIMAWFVWYRPDEFGFQKQYYDCKKKKIAACYFWYRPAEFGFQKK